MLSMAAGTAASLLGLGITSTPAADLTPPRLPPASRETEKDEGAKELARAREKLRELEAARTVLRDARDKMERGVRVRDLLLKRDGRLRFRVREKAASPLREEQRYSAAPVLKDQAYLLDVFNLCLALDAVHLSLPVALERSEGSPEARALFSSTLEKLDKLADGQRWLSETAADKSNAVTRPAPRLEELDELLKELKARDPGLRRTLEDNERRHRVWMRLSEMLSDEISSRSLSPTLYGARLAYIVQRITKAHPELGAKLSNEREVRDFFKPLLDNMVEDIEIFGPLVKVHRSKAELQEAHGGENRGSVAGFHEGMIDQVNISADTALKVALVYGHELGHAMVDVAEELRVAQFKETIAHEIASLEARVAAHTRYVKALETVEALEAQGADRRSLGDARFKLFEARSVLEEDEFTDLVLRMMDGDLARGAAPVTSVQGQVDEVAADLMQAVVFGALSRKYPDIASELFEFREIHRYVSSPAHFGSYAVARELIEKHGGDPAAALRWLASQRSEDLVKGLGPKIEEYNRKVHLHNSRFALSLSDLARSLGAADVFLAYSSAREALLKEREGFFKEASALVACTTFSDDVALLAKRLQRFLKLHSPASNRIGGE